MQDKYMETMLGKAKPGFYKFIRKDPSDPAGRAYGSAILVTGKKSDYQPYKKYVEMQFIPLDKYYRFRKYSESSMVKIEIISNKEGFDAIFSR